MSTRKKSRSSRRGLTKAEVVSKIKRRNLGDILKSIYSHINLDTKMSCICTCCNVSMPSMNSCEFSQIRSKIWSEFSVEERADIVGQCVEYFFKNEFEKWGISTLVKPCLLQDRKTGLCKIYEDRPLSCRMYGLWPKDAYEKRVDRFVKVYEKYGLAKEDLPLFSQCPCVERLDKSVSLTNEIINDLYTQLDMLDKKVGSYSDLQIKNKNNYRSFHDWMLLSVFGEEWLSQLTSFMLASDRKTMEDQIEQLKVVIKDLFKKGAI